MGLLISTLATLLVILSLTTSNFMQSEAHEAVLNQSFHQESNVFSDYSNFVRNTLREHQENQTGEYNLAVTTLNGGGIVGIRGMNPVTGATILSPYNNRDPEYITQRFIQDNKVGHALAKVAPYADPKSSTNLYLWTVPDSLTGERNENMIVFIPERSFDALVKKEYGESKLVHYIKHGNTLVRNGAEGTYALRADLAARIPDGALVVISHPFEKGPVAD